MSSILFAKHVSFEHSVSSPRPVITSRREKETTRPTFFSTQSTVSPLHAPSSAGTCCLHVLSELGRGAASFLATESTGTVLIPRLMTRIAGHAVYVIRGLHTSLLGRPAIQALHVLQRPQVDSLSAMVTDNPGSKNNVISDYPQLCTGLGEMDGTPHLTHLADNATPYSLCTPRRVPAPLIAKVDATLSKMESQGVIRRIDGPTEWCAGMVVVPKSNGDVRVCGDFTKLNHSIQRERHILPSVEHLLATIGNATVFLKLDANSGFHQIVTNPTG